MANREHLEVVKQGAEAIRQWREANPKERLDLSMMPPVEAGLNVMDLIVADLSEADLQMMHFIGTDLRGADLRGADLKGADLSLADLRGANLSGADLGLAKLRKTHLRATTFNKSILAYTVFADVDLSLANGLEMVEHMRPSVIGVDTLYESKGKIPKIFLRRCGLRPWEILTARLYDLTLTPHQISELQYRIFAERTKGYFLSGVFISHSHTDSEFVDKLYECLQKEGANVWLDRHAMVAGSMQKQVFDGIRMNDIVLLILSESSINSDWVENELEMARRKEKEQKRDVLCPVALDDSWKGKVQDMRSDDRHLWRTLTKKNILDFSGWRANGFEEPFRQLIEGIKRYYGPEVSS